MYKIDRYNMYLFHTDNIRKLRTKGKVFDVSAKEKVFDEGVSNLNGQTSDPYTSMPQA